MKLSDYIKRFYSDVKDDKKRLKKLAHVIKDNYELHCRLILRKKSVYDVKID